MIDAESALKMGLLSSVVENDQLDNEIQRYCEIILANGSHAMRVAKELIAEVNDQPLTDEVIKRTSAVIAELRGTEEAQKRLAVF